MTQLNQRMWAAFCAIGLLHCNPALAGTDHSIYTNTLAAGWQNWSWSTTVNFANASPTVGGSGASIAVSYTASWAGFYLHSTSNFIASDYDTFRFAIHGGSSGGGQLIEVRAYDGSLNAGPAIVIPPLAPNSWTTISIPVTQLGIAQISGFTWQDRSGAAQPTYYIDDIVLIAGESPPPLPLTLTVNATGNPRAIDPDIYGINFADAALAADLRLPVRRWGGNATTRYSYIYDTSNRASDWFFENIPNDNPSPQNLPTGSASDKFIE